MTAAYTTELRRPTHATTALPAWLATLVVFIIVMIRVAVPQAHAQGTAFSANGGGAGAPAAAAEAPTDIDLIVGRSTLVNVGATIARVSLTVPDIADAMVTTPNQLLIHGKQPGTISLFVWDRGGAIKTYEVTVRRDLTALVAQLKQLFPGEPIGVMGSGKDVIVSGTVSSKYVMEKAADVAAGYVEKKENVVNLMKQQEGMASNQVLLRVRFAEVSRNAVQELGASLFSDGNNNYFGRSSTQQFAAPFFNQQEPLLGKTLVFSDYLNLFLFDAKNQIGAVVKALQAKGAFQSLAEPNLIALNGREASFLAGGEFPYPVPQGGLGSVAIHFKEFGVRLSFTPTVLGGDLINLKIKPEVSTLDFNNAVVIEGFRVPALTTRRADTEVELRDGQTFAIAGLMNNTALSSMRKVPGLGDIPVLGLLFRSRAYQKEQTELVVMVTPTIVRKDSVGASEGLPSLVEPFLVSPDRVIPPPAPYTGSPRYPANEAAPNTNTPNAASSSRPGSKANMEVGRPVAIPAVPSGPTAQKNTPASPVPSRSIATAAPVPTIQAQGQPLTREQRKAIERAREQERKAAAAAARERVELERREAEARKAEAKAEEKRRAERARVEAEEARRDAEARREAEKIAREQERRKAEETRKAAEAAKRKADEEQKRQKALDEAAARLKEAQAAYQTELEKAKASHAARR
jgi:pilus assembly protein CpaC